MRGIQLNGSIIGVCVAINILHWSNIRLAILIVSIVYPCWKSQIHTLQWSGLVFGLGVEQKLAIAGVHVVNEYSSDIPL